MRATYTTTVIGFKNHASLHVPDEVLVELGANRRAPLKITINGHTYRSTTTAVDGECRVVFPQAERDAAGVGAGDQVLVELELETGHREVELPAELADALVAAGLREKFESMTYSKRKEFARQVAEAKAAETRAKRVEKVLSAIR